MQVHNRNFVLVPEDRGDRVFSQYHLSHRHAARIQDTDAPGFQIPTIGDRYPRSSLPALEAATWVREVHPALFPAFDLALFEAFFARTEDISNPDVLGRVGASAGLDPSAVCAALRAGAYRATVLGEHLEATDRGIHGIPTLLIPGEAPIVGALPYADLRRAVEQALPGVATGPGWDPGSNASVIEGSRPW